MLKVNSTQKEYQSMHRADFGGINPLQKGLSTAKYLSLKCILLQAQEEEAAKKIQSVFKGFNVRKKQLQPAVTITLTSPDDDHWYGYDEDEYYNQPQEDMPDLNCPDVARAVVQIQKAYRGFQVCQSDYLA